MTKRMTWILTAFSLVAANPGHAHAQGRGPLSECLIAKVSRADQLTLVRWIFGVMTASPQVKDMSTITTAQRDELSKQAGQIFNRLVTVDCRAEAVQTIKQDGDGALEKAFGALGEYSMEGLIKDPAVINSMVGLLAGVDVREWAKVQIEAGVTFGTKTRK
ncbi:MAG: hypothetical protein K2W81_09015 [Sphingomonas sp.]|uniref:hypothetical protein n=1 Tax=Sphingomonas sp. TaxID=28214 RepID=UPI0025F48324|nr:hypothetical protein [Sphingomonas sp.]MBY0284089.1 hypothetical protein [Sphingomonas sp.]